MKPIFIAEPKTQSMYRFKSKYSREHLFELAIEKGDWLSIHTDARFGGSFDDIYFTRQKTDKPILAKGFHTHNDDIKKALDLGADYVLVVDRLPENLFRAYPDKLIFELSNLNNIEKFSYDFIEWGKFIYNGRDLNTGIGKKYIGDYYEYRKKFKWLCGASLIHTKDEVQRFYPNCDAFIVGQNLVEYCKSLDKL